MPPKTLILGMLLALTLMPVSGCVVRVPNGTEAPPARTYATSWVEQLKLQIAPASAGQRVAAAGAHGWHRVRLQVGRVDDAIPVLTRTVDPYEDSLGDLAAEGFAPGDGYWVRVSLIQVGDRGLEWEVGSGMLGGQGQSVRFQPGPNAVPIPILPTVAGAQLATSPTPLRRAGRSRVSASGVITIGTGGSGDTVVLADDTDTDTVEIDPLLDWLLSGSDDDDGDDDEDEGDDEEYGYDGGDDDASDLGDWFGTSAALKAPGRGL